LTISSIVTRKLRTTLCPGFTEWSELWSHAGLWLSLWDDRAQMTQQTHRANAFWEALIRHSSRYNNRIGHIVRRAQQAGSPICELDPAEGMLLIAVPIRHHRRTIGSVLACGLSSAFFDEENFARFCDTYQVDRLVFAQMAVDIPRHKSEQLQAYANILAHHFHAFNEQGFAQREIHDLSTHLARTYEELHLLYRVSAGMSVYKNPSSHFEQLCEELLDATVIKGFTVVLESPQYVLTEPVIIRAGDIDASSDDLVRLYQQVRHQSPNAGDALVVNDAGNQPEFAWASGWLEQFVFYHLVKRDSCFGGVLAVNHTDETEFDSYAIQLISALAERSAAYLENVQLYDGLERLFSGLLHALVSSIDAKDPYTCGHSQRVAWLSRLIARFHGLPETKCQRVYLSGLLHDIGKIGISEAVLRKTGRLTHEEFQEMKRHSEIGSHILEGIPQVADTLPGIMHHHERMDGRGYPSGLPGKEIPLFGRLIGLADSYDAMTTNRTYRKALPLQIAMAEIRRCSGTQFDPHLADLFLQQDLQTVHHEMTEFGNQPIGAHPTVGIGSFLGETL